MKPILDIDTSPPAVVNALIAKHVEGWTFQNASQTTPGGWFDKAGFLRERPDYLSSEKKITQLLRRHKFRLDYDIDGIWHIEIGMGWHINPAYQDNSFTKAAAVPLLIAHGVDVRESGKTLYYPPVGGGEVYFGRTLNECRESGNDPYSYPTP